VKRTTLVAVGYGFVGAGLGVWLMTRGAVGNRLNTNERAAETPVLAAVETDAGLVTEVGPDGIRWISAAGGAHLSGAAADRPVESTMEAQQRLEALAGVAVPRLPESGKELLRLGDPAIQAVADLLTAAGTSEPLLEVSLRGVFGHVQRLATFRQMARLDAERAAELEREYAALDPGDRPPTPPPSLHWRAEVWQRRSEQYVEYMRRDLETRLGIRDEKAPARLIAIAEELFAREQGASRVEAAPVEAPR
jgi:hypothetical protein